MPPTCTRRWSRFWVAGILAASAAGGLWWALRTRTPQPTSSPAPSPTALNAPRAQAQAPDHPTDTRIAPPTPELTIAAPPAETEIEEPKQSPASAAADPIAAFDAWLNRFSGHRGEATTEDSLAEGILLARRRRQALFALIEADPQAALAAAVPMARRVALPAALDELLEERVSGRGYFSVQVADNFETGRREVRREAVVNQQRYQAFVYGARLSQPSQEHVPLWGIAVRTPNGRRLAVHEDAARRLEPGEAAPRTTGRELCLVSNRPASAQGTPVAAEVGGVIEHFCGSRHLALLNQRLATDSGFTAAGSPEPFLAQDSWSQGPKTCLFMRVVFPDDPTEPISEDGAYALLDGVNQWYVENSYGTTSITPTVTPLLLLPQTKVWYGAQGTGALLADARSAALAAGYDTDNYDWDMVRHTSVPGPGFAWSGLAQVRGKGLWLQSSALNVACHELGHNYGLWHANSWSAPGDSVIGPGSNLEYGNTFDTMSTIGAGNNQFNAAFKNELDWLPISFVSTITQSGTYRLHAYDVPGLAAGQIYALRVRKNYGRNYWVEFRQKFPTNPWLQNGVLLNWDPWNNGVANSAGGTQLLDTTPGTQAANNGKDDAAVTLGRTFSDFAAGVHLTPVAVHHAGGDDWIDVVVQLGAAPNTPPAALLTADRIFAGVNIPVHFSVSANDPDNDPLAYAWEFGDDTVGPNSATATKAWANAGDYVVRCTVSDMKGGLFSQSLLITVGNPVAFRLSGTITTSDGLPLAGARLHNGLSGAAYRSTYSDSDGHYVLANLPAASLSLSAVKYGYRFTYSGWTNPVVPTTNPAGLDWIAVADSVVSIEAASATADENGPLPGRFRITRTGPTNMALTVKLNRAGSALNGTDYTLSPAPTGSPLQWVIPAGAPSLDILATPIHDTQSEGPEEITLSLIEDTAYVLGPAEATLTILDDNPAAKPTVDVSAVVPAGPADNVAVESGTDGGAFAFTRTGSLERELVVYYSVSGTAAPGVDYSPLPGVVTIPAGASVTIVPFAVIDDPDVEPDETVVVTILGSPAYNGAGDSDVVTILDDDPPKVFITATDDPARESGVSAGAFTVSRTGSLAANLLVRYELGGSASNGLDYAALPGAVLLPAGHASATIVVSPLNDLLSEGDETVTATLLSSASYNVGNPGTATLSLQDDELATVTFSASTPTATEAGPNPGAFTFVRSGDTSQALQVHFAISGAALNGSDYVHIENSLLIPAGAPSAVLTILPLDDTIKEADEKVALVLLPDPAYNVGTAIPQSVTIKDNDAGLPGVGFTLARSEGVEANPLARLSVSLSTNAPGTVTVDYAVTGGTATGGGVDYILNAGTLSFPAGVVNQSLNLFVVNDTLAESNETVVVTLSNPVGAQLDALVEHTYTILDDDASGIVTVQALTPVATEAGLQPGAFHIVRSRLTGSDQPVFIQFSGTASSPSDYLPIANPIVIPAGAASIDVPVIPVDDATDESDETVVLTITSAPGAQIGSPSSATVVILDNDDSSNLPVVTVRATDPTGGEAGTDQAQFTITRSAPTNDALTVSFTLTGTATAGTDYLNPGTTALIPAGAFEATVPITPRDDAVFEGDETVVLTLTQLPEYRVGIPAGATALLRDDEVGVSIVASGDSIEDGSAIGQFVITRTGNLASNLTVRFLVGGTADLEDFQPLENSVEIPAGTNAVALPVIPIDDHLPEGDETVVLSLVSGSGYTVVQPNNATVTIRDDEPGVSVVARDAVAYEGGDNHAAFTLMRSGRVAEDLTVLYTLSGSAQNGVDYVLLPETAVLPAGETSLDLEVVPLDDGLVEGNETVQLTLQASPAYAITIPASASVTILDDELNLVPVVTITSPTADLVFLPALTNALVLEGEAVDDGRPNPPGILTTVWTRRSGPGVVTFGNPNALSTIARFSLPGVYSLRLSASDGQLTAARDLTVVVAPEAALAAGLQAYWNFDETGGVTAADGSGHARDATLAHGASFVPGPRSNALDLDGLDDIATFASMDLTQLTITAWIRPESPGNSLTPRVLAMPGYNVRIRRDPAATTNAVALESERTSVAGEWRSPGNVVSDGVWVHVAVAYDSSQIDNAPLFFINGSLKPTTRRVTPVGSPIPNAGVGAIGNSVLLDRGWDGQIDDVRIYNRLLTPSEIRAIAAGPATNLAPVVDAGAPQTIELGADAVLHGSVTDDSQPNPPGGVTVHWIRVNGPGSVTFENPELLDTTATFSDGGVYVLRLIADDGQVKVAADVAVTVQVPTVVRIQAVDRTASEFGSDNQQGTGGFGLFTIQRTGDPGDPLTVRLGFGGSALNGVDYLFLTNFVVIPMNAMSATLAIRPISDDLPEGEETVRLSILPDPAYMIGAPAADTVFVEDAPWDQWRFEHFTAEELRLGVMTGPSADPDGDGLPNLLEYAFGSDPRAPDYDPGFHAALEPLDGSSGTNSAVVVRFHRRMELTDLAYEIQTSFDGIAWNVDPSAAVELFPRLDDGNGETETARVRILDGGFGRRLVRLKVRLR